MTENPAWLPSSVSSLCGLFDMLLARPGLPKKWDDSCDDIEEHSPTYRPTQAIYKQLDS